MKKILLLMVLPIVALSFWSCDTFDAKFDGVEELARPPYRPNIQFALTDADYTEIEKQVPADLKAQAKTVGTNKYFTPDEDAHTLLPYLLKYKFKSVDDGTYANVTYRYYQNFPQELESLSEYTLKNTDYAVIWGMEGLNFVNTAKEAEIPAVLKTALPEAEANNVVAVTYNFNDGAVSSITAFDVDFQEGGYVANTPTTVDGWLITNLKSGTSTSYGFFKNKSFQDNFYTEMTANNAGTDVDIEAWMISPKVRILEGMELTFDIVVAFYNGDVLSVKVSENFNGTKENITAATWTDITDKFTIPVEPTSGYGSWTNVGAGNMDEFVGKDVYIAIQYEGTTVAATKKTTTVQLDNIILAAEGDGDESSPNIVQNKLYKYNGTAWSLYNDAYMLMPADYTAMGLRFANFDNRQASEHYLPTFLADKYPYAFDGDEVTVVFRLFQPSGLQAEKYTRVDGVWTADNTVTEQYKYVAADQTWKFDPSVVMTIVKGDGNMQKIVDWVVKEKGQEWRQVKTPGDPPVYYDNAEYWSGASEYQGNFERRIATRRTEEARVLATGNTNAVDFTDLTDEEVLAIIDERIEIAIGGFLTVAYPNATPVSGVDVLYTVIFETYNQGDRVRINFSVTYKCIGTGQFELYEGMTPVE